MNREPMRCTLEGEFDEDWSAYLDGELSAGRAAELDQHLETCARCRGHVEALERVDAALAEAPAPAVRADLWARLQERIEAGSPSRRLRRPLFAGLLAAAAALAIYLAAGPGTTPDAPTRRSELAEAPPAVPSAGLDGLPDEELMVVLDLETIEDLEVIANLDLLEMLIALEEGTG